MSVYQGTVSGVTNKHLAQKQHRNQPSGLVGGFNPFEKY